MKRQSLAPGRPERQRGFPWYKVPLLIWLVIVWGALWRDFSVGNLVFGLIIAIAVTQVFYLPPIELSGRFNVLRAPWFALRFLFDVTIASFQVLWWSISKGPNIRNAVIQVPLRSSSDLMMTAVGHVLSLIPGSLVVEVDRSSSTLYVHAMNIETVEAADKVRHDIQDIEARLIRIMGTREEVKSLGEEKDGQIIRVLPPAMVNAAAQTPLTSQAADSVDEEAEGHK